MQETGAEWIKTKFVRNFGCCGCWSQIAIGAAPYGQCEKSVPNSKRPEVGSHHKPAAKSTGWAACIAEFSISQTQWGHGFTSMLWRHRSRRGVGDVATTCFFLNNFEQANLRLFNVSYKIYPDQPMFKKAISCKISFQQSYNQKYREKWYLLQYI